VTSSVDGLISGLSTTSMIQQLMAAEAAPQDKLKSSLTDEQTATKAYQAVNTKMSAIQTAAEALTGATGWQAMKSSSDNASVSVAAGTTATAGQIAFNVTQLARAQVSTAIMPASGDVVGPGGLNIAIGKDPSDPNNSVTTNIAVTDLKTNTAQGLADAINAKGLSVRAAVVTNDAGDTLVQFTSTKTGVANQFGIDGLTGSAAQLAVTAKDAKISIGDAGASGAYSVTSSSNTFTNLMPGLTITASAVTTSPVTVTTTTDTSAISAKVKAMVDAANDALSGISDLSSYDATNKVGGPLLSDSTTRFISQNILSAVSNGKTGYGSFSQLGITLDQTGKITFDADKFAAAMASDPAKVQDALQNGLAATYDTQAKGATNSVDGSLTVAIQGRNARVKDLTDQIADWDTRLQTKKEALQKQFADLEVALGKLKDQSSWLSGQIASLPSGSAG
jgi:flagellar hook-associated protein 2